MATASTQAPSEDVVYDSTVEGLFRRGLGRLMTEKCKARLKAAGLDLDGKLSRVYPRLRYYEFVNIAADELYAGRSRDDAHYELGKQFMAGYGDTLIGRAVLSMVKLLGPKKTLLRMTQNMQSSNNYMQTSTKELGPGSYELSLSQVSGAPRYFEGVIFSGLSLAGAKNVQVRIAKREGNGVVLRCDWDEKK
jgi:uncharacterized protein (TIGR02265 family)